MKWFLQSVGFFLLIFGPLWTNVLFNQHRIVRAEKRIEKMTDLVDGLTENQLLLVKIQTNHGEILRSLTESKQITLRGELPEDRISDFLEMIERLGTNVNARTIIVPLSTNSPWHGPTNELLIEPPRSGLRKRPLKLAL